MFSSETIQKMVKAREAGDFTDCTLVCEGYRISVHSIIVCTQSPVFYAARTGPFKEADGAYKIEDYPLEMVRRMVDYLYTGNYSLKYETSDPEMHCELGALRVHAMMFTLADKYIIKGLQALTQYYYRKSLSSELDIFDFLSSMQDVYKLTPDSVRGLRDPALYYARETLPKALASSDKVKACYEQIFVDVPEFTKDLLDLFLRKPFLGSCSSTGCNDPVLIEILQCRCMNCGRGGANTVLEKYRGCMDGKSLVGWH